MTDGVHDNLGSGALLSMVGQAYARWGAEAIGPSELAEAIVFDAQIAATQRGGRLDDMTCVVSYVVS